MNLVPGISLYNQDRLDDDNFVENFVARIEIVEALLNVLRQAAAGRETEHQVLVGARGMGKTSLLRRLAIAVGRDKHLRTQFIPLRFREEQYNVISLDTFWRNCGEALAEWCEANGDHDTAERIDQATDSPDWRDAEKAADAFLGFCAGLGRRPCLLIDNLDLVLDGLRDEGWALRHVLQRPGGPVVIGAASQMLTQGAERDGPFYEFFHPLLLEPLSEAELLRCMHSLADRRGDAGARVKAVLARAPERIRTLYALTGGNPRILSLIYQLMERAETDTIFADLEALLDQVTPFYKARIEEYSGSQQRAIIDAIALNWDPITSSALGEVTGIEVTTISSQLAPLRRDGFIEQVQTSGARAGYQLGERFLNIWYLMRHGTRKTRQRLRWLTIFLTKLFSAEELGQMAADARDTARGGLWHPDFREAVIEAYDTAQSTAPKPRKTELPTATSAHEVIEEETSDAVAMLQRASQHLTEGESEQAMAVYDEIVRRFGDAAEPSLREFVAFALFNKGVALGQIGRSEEAIAAYDEVVERFGDTAEPSLQESVAGALFNKGLALGQIGRSEDEIAAYDQVVARFGDVAGQLLHGDVASALVNKGVVLDQLGRGEEAIATYDEVVGRFGDTVEPTLRESVAGALFNKGVALRKLGRGEEAVAVYDAVVGRFGDATEPSLLEKVAGALFNKGVALDHLGRSEEAIAAYDEVVRRFGDAAEPSLQEQVAKALVNKGIALDQLGRTEDEIATYGQVVRRFGKTTEPLLQEKVARALVNKGIALDQLGRGEEAIAVFDEAIGRCGATPEPSLQATVASALVNKGVALDQLNRGEEAIASYDEVLGRFGDTAEPSLQESIAGALVNKGITLRKLGRGEEAVAAYDATVGRFGDATEPSLLEKVAEALLNKGVALDQLGCGEEAIATYDEVVGRFGDAAEPSMQEELARALVNKGRALERLDRGEEAIATYDEVVVRFGAAATTPFLQDQVGWALGKKGRVLFDAFARSQQAEICYREALAIRPDLTDRGNLIWSLIAQKRDGEAEETRQGLTDIAKEGMALISAGIEIVRDNLGSALGHLGDALDAGLEPGVSNYFEDILWLLRIGVDQGYGEKLIEWFAGSGNADRYAPIYGALVARVRGERFLLDLNPEVRPKASDFYRVLAVTAAAAPTAKGTRGRRRGARRK